MTYPNTAGCAGRLLASPWISAMRQSAPGPKKRTPKGVGVVQFEELTRLEREWGFRSGREAVVVIFICSRHLRDLERFDHPPKQERLGGLA